MKKIAVLTVLAVALLQTGFAMAVEAGHHEHAATKQLTLNDGRKWTADKHTADSVAAMKATVHDAQGKAAAATAADLQAVGAELQGQLQALIRGCTMTGADHDQLHTWISLLAPEIQKLAKADTAETGRAALGEIAALVESFEAHFDVAAPAP